ncbi:MAG: CoB--CoM heterodisulfide reductase iron-sulfur subunit B family protein [Myxococcales bacterium]|jgi:heterodisulfide reductase subunit B
MKLGYFPGCSLHATALEFDRSLKAIAGPLGIELKEIKEWSCCGATSAHQTNHLLAVSLAARNLALAESQGIQQVMAPCAACFSRLATARHEITRDEALGARVNEVLRSDFANSVEVQSILALLRPLASKIRENARAGLQGLKVACYYGCLLLRPPEVVRFDDCEDPSSMEEIVAAAGAAPVKWSKRLECCGAGLSISRTASVVRLGRAILEDARRAGAEAIVVACPMCHTNLDLRQKAMLQRGEAALPVLFLTQLVGLGLGIEPGELGLDRHFISTKALIARVAGGGEGVAKAS